MKSRLMFLEICGLFLFCMNMHGQYRFDPPVQNNDCLLTGSLHQDFQALNSNQNTEFNNLAIDTPDVKKLNVAIINFRALGGLTTGEAEIITESFSAHIMNSGLFKLVERERIKEILKEQGFQQSEVCSQIECAVEIGKVLKVEKIFLGSIGMLGKSWHISVQYIDVSSAQVEFIVTEQYEGRIEDLLQVAVPSLSEKLIAKLSEKLQHQTTTSISREGINNQTSSLRLYSPLRAGLFSAVIPGAGQFYTKNYWQSAAFFGAEVLMWVIYATYEKKGDNQTNNFQKYADDNWSAARYADWINHQFGQAIFINTDPNLHSWEQVNWSELNTAEESIGKTTGTGFTHKLAPHGDQQYYEMIGKYSQFGGGWDDAATFQAGGFTAADVIANSGLGNVSPHFLDYSKMRGDANSFYNIATTVSYVVVANHVLSALEAAWNASKLNHRIKLQGHIESRQIYGNIVEFVPTLHLEYEL